MPTVPQPLIAPVVLERSTTIPSLTTQQHSSSSDDYMRLFSSPSGKYLASITTNRQLTLFDLQLNQQFLNFSQLDVIHVSFSQAEDKFLITTRAPGIKLFQIKKTNTQKKQILLVKQIKPQLFASYTYGWSAWTLDNKHLLYVKANQLYYFNTQTYKSTSASKNPADVKSKCLPHFIALDRQNNQLISSSQSGIICRYQLSLPSSAISSTPSSSSPIPTLLSITQSTKLSTPIGDLNQGKDFLILNSGLITQNKTSFYTTFVMSKKNLGAMVKLRLQKDPKLMSIPVMVSSDNVQNYIIAALKGQSTAYVYNLQQIQNQFIDEELMASDDLTNLATKTIPYDQKLTTPFLVHSVHYVKPANRLLMGTAGASNQDSIVSMSFNFNCSELSTLPLKEAAKPTCQEECLHDSQMSYFSFAEGQCLVKGNKLSMTQKDCLVRKSYLWNERSLECELQCQKVVNVMGKTSWGVPEQCVCGDGFLWYGKTAECLTEAEIKQRQAQVINNGTNGTTNTTNSTTTNPTTPTNSTTTNSTTPTNNSKITPSNNTAINNSTTPTTNNTTSDKPSEDKTKNNTTINNNTNINNTNPSFNDPNINTKNNSIVPTDPSNVNDKTLPIDSNPSQPQQNPSDQSSPVSIILLVIIILLIIVIAIVIYLFKYKKLCFKNSEPYVEENQLKEDYVKSDIQQNKTDEAKSNPSYLSSPQKLSAHSDKISQYQEEIKTDSNDNDYDARVDSQRKFN